jgi:uncharacterized membrane protein
MFRQIERETGKWVHIVSSTILFGTRIGSAFCLLMANRSKEVPSIYFATRTVVIADFLFTSPAAVVQLLTGLWLLRLTGYSLSDSWVKWGLALYFFAGACWLPVVWMQVEMRDMARAGSKRKNPCLSGIGGGTSGGPSSVHSRLAKIGSYVVIGGVMAMTGLARFRPEGAHRCSMPLASRPRKAPRAIRRPVPTSAQTFSRIRAIGGAERRSPVQHRPHVDRCAYCRDLAQVDASRRPLAGSERVGLHRSRRTARVARKHLRLSTGSAKGALRSRAGSLRERHNEAWLVHDAATRSQPRLHQNPTRRP